MARQSFSRLFAQRARDCPHQVVVIDGDTELTADALDRRSNALAREYLARGVRRDDLVTVSLPTGIEFVVACAAIWKAGATPHPVAAGLDRAERAELERLARPALALGAPPVDRSIPWLPEGFTPATSDAEVPDAWASCWKAPVSSGSTGRPKVVLAAAPALLDPDHRVAPFLPRRAVQLVGSPLWHSASFTYAFRGLLTGHQLILAECFDEHRFGELVQRYRVTWTLLSPSMIHRLVRAPRHHDVGSLQSVVHLGAPCAPDDKRELINWLGAEKIIEVYAGSESNGLTMITGPEWLRKPGSVGRGIGGTRIRIRRADGTEAAPGEIGEIWLRRGARPAYRYLGAESRRTGDGWDTLGDLGAVDHDGYLTVIDRIADVIQSVPYPVYPSQVEHVLESHPAIRGAVVFGRHDRVAAVVEVADDGIDAEVVRAFARARLAPHEMPDHITVTHGPLRNEAGKVRRRDFAVTATTS